MSILPSRLLRRPFRAIAAAIASWIVRERTIRELSRLSERELADLGLTPAMIPFVASPKFTAEAADEGRRRAANDNGVRRSGAANA